MEWPAFHSQVEKWYWKDSNPATFPAKFFYNKNDIQFCLITGIWYILFVWFDSLRPNQQSFSYKGTGLPGLNQY